MCSHSKSTQASEAGAVYSVDEVHDIAEITLLTASAYIWTVPASPMPWLAWVSPAEITWRAGVDVLSFGATKMVLWQLKPWFSSISP